MTETVDLYIQIWLIYGLTFLAAVHAQLHAMIAIITNATKAASNCQIPAGGIAKMSTVYVVPGFAPADTAAADMLS